MVFSFSFVFNGYHNLSFIFNGFQFLSFVFNDFQFLTLIITGYQFFTEVIISYHFFTCNKYSIKTKLDYWTKADGAGLKLIQVNTSGGRAPVCN